MTKPRKLLIRKFLNKKGHHSIAAVHAELGPVTSYGLDAADITITDCYKKVSLDFGLWWGRNTMNKEADFNNALFKLNTLINTLVAFRDRYVEMYEYAMEQNDADT